MAGHRRSDGTDARQRAWRAFIATSSVVLAALDDEMRAGVELSLAEYDALLHTFEAGDDGVRMSELAARVLLTRAGLTSLVDRLQDRGLLQRVPDPDDRRATRVVLTEAGVALFREAAALHVDGIANHFTDHLDEREAQVFVEVLSRVRRAATAADDPA